jgi:hypothetical protein
MASLRNDAAAVRSRSVAAAARPISPLGRMRALVRSFAGAGRGTADSRETV